MSNLISKEVESEDEFVLILGENLSGGSDAMEFQSRVNEILKNGNKKIVLDLSNIKIINSSGLGMIVATHSNLKKDSAALFLRNIPQKVDELIKMTHLDKVLKIESK